MQGSGCTAGRSTECRVQGVVQNAACRVRYSCETAPPPSSLHTLHTPEKHPHHHHWKLPDTQSGIVTVFRRIGMRPVLTGMHGVA
jgi:hypothetical protein